MTLVYAPRPVLQRRCVACGTAAPAQSFRIINPWRSTWVGAADPTYRCPMCHCAREAACFPFIKEFA
jgi:hypothetical protein